MSTENIKAGAAAPKKTFGQKCNDGCQSFGKFMWNSQTREFMGRTGVNWAKIGLFYLIFYGFLAGFFAAMLAIFITTLNPVDGEGGPTLTQFIKNQPGLTRLDTGSNSLRSYNVNDTTYLEAYSKFMNSFLAGYDNITTEDCSTTERKPIPAGQPPCRYPYQNLLKGCLNDSFGLAAGKPCVFVRMNKVFNWVPQPIGNSLYLNLTCSNNVKVFPPGFLVSAFPFRGQKGYIPPIVGVQLEGTGASTTCYINGVGTSVSKSTAPEQAYGKILIGGIIAKST